MAQKSPPRTIVTKQAEQTKAEPEVEQTFLGNDIFKQIKEKYMRDSVHYAKEDFEDYGMHSMSEISQGIIQNKEAKLGIMQQSLRSSQGSMDLAGTKNVKDILAKYK
jgi:hypothetical protein